MSDSGAWSWHPICSTWWASRPGWPIGAGRPTELTPSTPLGTSGLDDLGLLQVAVRLDQLLVGQGHGMS